MNDSARFPNRSTELETASTPKLDEWRVESETLPMPRPEERLPSTIDEPHAEPVKPPAPAEPAHPGPGPTPKPAPEARPPMPGGLNHVDPPAGAIEVPTAPVAGESHAGKVYGALPEFTPPPADAKVDANTLRQMQDDFKAAWKNEKFLYRDAKGRVYQIEGVLGEGQFNRAYRLGGEGNEGRIMKVRLKDQYGGTGPGTLADRAQAVRESKALSDELARRGIPDLRIHDAVVDNDPPYVIMDLADPKKGYRILGRDIKEGYIPPSVDPVTGRPLTREEVDKALLQHLASKGIDRRHGEALRDLIDRIASEGWAAEDLKFDNVYFREEGGKVTAGIADHERIGPMDQPDLRDWQEYYNPYSAADKAKGKIKHRELLMETLDRSQQQIDALQAKSPRSAADEDALQRALAAQAATRKGMAKVDGDLDNLLAKSLNRSRIRSLAAVPVEQRLGIDLAKADPRYWAAKMFEHNGWVYYDAAAGNFRPSWIDPEWLKPKFDLDGYLGPPPLKPGALRLVPWPWAPVIACAPPVRRAA